MENQIRAYFKNEGEAAAVFLYGPYAKGNATELSDIDIGVLFEISDRNTIDDLLEDYLVEISRILRKDVHLVALNFAGETLLLQVFKTGKCLRINNPKRLAEFKMSAYSRIFDFNYHRNKMKAGLIRRVVHGRS